MNNLIELTGRDGGTYILNSQMFCLINIYGMYEKTDDPEIKEFFDRGIERLERDIDNYNANYTKSGLSGTIYDKYTFMFKPHKDHPEYAVILKYLQEKTNNTTLERVYYEWVS